MDFPWSLKRVFLRTLIVALLGSAVIGIYAFLFGDFGETEAKILLTTLSISYFSILSLACAAALEKGKFAPLAATGLAASAVGFLTFLPGIWSEWFDNQTYGKTMLVLAIYGFSFAQACLLALMPLENRLRWILFTTVGVVLALATLISGMIVFETGDEWLFRIAGVLGILDGCGSLLIPVLYKLGGKEVSAAPGSRLARIELACPRCGCRGAYPAGELACRQCGLRMRVEVLQELPEGTAGNPPEDAPEGIDAELRPTVVP